MFTVAQLAARWLVTERTVRRWIAQRRLAVVQLGRRCAVRIPQTEVERWEKARA